MQNAMANIYIRRLLTPARPGNSMPVASSMMDLLASLESKLGLSAGTNGVGTTSTYSNRITEIPYTSPDYDSSEPSSPHS